jgi:hypothetical protein
VIRILVVLVLLAALPARAEVASVALRTGRAYAFKSIAVDAAERRVFLGSWREKAIVVVDLAGGPPRVIASRYNGKLNGMGVHLRGDRLYAVMNEVDDRPGAKPIAVLLVIDAATERVLHAHELRAETTRHHFNHVVVDARGAAYVSDTVLGRIYRVDTTDPKARFELVLAHADLSWVHGVALVANETLLATTSYKGGVRFLELATRRWKPYRDLTTAGADGLVYHAGSLYGVGGAKITRYVLDAREAAIVRSEVVLRDHALFDDPRDLQVRDGWLYCLANLDPARQRDTHLLKLRLDERGQIDERTRPR